MKSYDRVGTYHINLLKKFEERDEFVISGVAFIEAKPSSEVGVVDDESFYKTQKCFHEKGLLSG